MEKVQIYKQEIIKWCDEQVAEGKELKLLWDGGGDSGWVHFELDGEDITNDAISALIDAMYDLLDYGGWAGEFSANGEALYDPEIKSFVGIDHYGEDDSVDWPVKIKVRVPADVFFDSITIEMEDEAVTDVTFNVKNGFTEDNMEVIDKIKAQLNDDLDVAIAEFSKEYQFRSIWQNETYEKSDFVKAKNGDLILTITSIDMGMTKGEDKDVCLDLNNLPELNTVEEED